VSRHRGLETCLVELSRGQNSETLSSKQCHEAAVSCYLDLSITPEDVIPGCPLAASQDEAMMKMELRLVKRESCPVLVKVGSVRFELRPECSIA
jgi:hypothetical protein